MNIKIILINAETGTNEFIHTTLKKRKIMEIKKNQIDKIYLVGKTFKIEIKKFFKIVFKKNDKVDIYVSNNGKKVNILQVGKSRLLIIAKKKKKVKKLKKFSFGGVEFKISKETKVHFNGSKSLEIYSDTNEVLLKLKDKKTKK